LDFFPRKCTCAEVICLRNMVLRSIGLTANRCRIPSRQIRLCPLLLESLRKKLTSRVALLRRLAGSGWSAGATTLRTSTLALVHSTAEHCAPVWCRSAHTRLIDPTINDALRIVTGCLRLTPASNTFQSSQASNLLSFVAVEPHHL